ncbi:MAG: hypothetical protein KJO36_09505 [Acidimicrobiia bacterium]|nr:hypothetical protein [Acidimicrobiia bacterium]
MAVTSHGAVVSSIRHLVTRFFEVARAKDLTTVEMSEVVAWLRPDLLELFESQQVADQRHGYECAKRILAQDAGRIDLVGAALLHDVGKRHARLGAIGRTLATIAGALPVPTFKRWSLYLDHPALGAAELLVHDADPIIVDFTRHQERDRPESIDNESWRLLRMSDLEAP